MKEIDIKQNIIKYVLKFKDCRLIRLIKITLYLD